MNVEGFRGVKRCGALPAPAHCFPYPLWLQGSAYPPVQRQRKARLSVSFRSIQNGNLFSSIM